MKEAKDCGFTMLSFFMMNDMIHVPTLYWTSILFSAFASVVCCAKKEHHR